MIQRTTRFAACLLSWKCLLGLAVVQAVSLAVAADKPVLRLATTMSVVDSGLAAAILPDFERRNACRVDVIAVGTGQALSIAGRGDADVVIVHARKQEDEFIAAGHAKQRYEIMHNDFILVGPADDPARAVGENPLRTRSERSLPPARCSSAAATRAARIPRNWRSGPPPDWLRTRTRAGTSRWAWEPAKCSWPQTRSGLIP